MNLTLFYITASNKQLCYFVSSVTKTDVKKKKKYDKHSGRPQKKNAFAVTKLDSADIPAAIRLAVSSYGICTCDTNSSVYRKAACFDYHVLRYGDLEQGDMLYRMVAT